MKNTFTSVLRKTAVVATMAGIGLTMQAKESLAFEYGQKSYSYSNAFQAEILQIKKVTMREDSPIAKTVGATIGGALGALSVKGKSTASQIGKGAMAVLGGALGAQVAENVANHVSPAEYVEITMRDRNNRIGVVLIPLSAAEPLRDCAVGNNATVVNTNNGPKILGCNIPLEENRPAAFGAISNNSGYNMVSNKVRLRF